jgi:RNA polymerase-binding transcription factor DksA
MVNNATLTETVETVSDPPLVSLSGEIWQRLQDEKLEVSESLLHDGRLFTAASDEAEEIEWRHHERLENRLRQLADAQDRLMEGRYGRCVDCGEFITARRLAADPAAALCYGCQSASDRKQHFYSL